MKITFTFEYADLLETIQKMLAMNGVTALKDDEGQDRIVFDPSRKEVIVECEASPFPESCLFCGKGVKHEPQTQQDDSSSKEEPRAEETSTEDSQANTDEEGNEPMSLAQLKAQSRGLASKPGPIRVQRGAEAHAELAQPRLMEGETAKPPFGED